MRQDIRDVLYGLAQHIQKKQSEAADDYGITTQEARVLLFVYEHVDSDKGVEMSRLASLLDVGASSISRKCARMEEEELIGRVSSDDDPRVRLVRLTSRGEQIAQALQKREFDYMSSLVSGIDAEDADVMLEAVRSLNRALQLARGPNSAEEE